MGMFRAFETREAPGGTPSNVLDLDEGSRNILTPPSRSVGRNCKSLCRDCTEKPVQTAPLAKETLKNRAFDWVKWRADKSTRGGYVTLFPPYTGTYMNTANSYTYYRGGTRRRGIQLAQLAFVHSDDKTPFTGEEKEEHPHAHSHR
ncbi:predicted protein [Coccidioides posadasii str. Silveira]|uniref:Predicted protein n=1 Tax=Coccidioides posadasii (strain RMSCC 757 / Silveira) TaxID=443226 RepID=E9CZC2_COCPS|nr:predicted protein [Coccidioides posadasii str. Silveira]